MTQNAQGATQAAATGISYTSYILHQKIPLKKRYTTGSHTGRVCAMIGIFFFMTVIF
ncbi:MAG: hypothetical protein LBD91_01680 [Prevotellaceae bacterium]|nr:hypothetical protein [Prevotellaceae bacterium]